MSYEEATTATLKSVYTLGDSMEDMPEGCVDFWVSEERICFETQTLETPQDVYNRLRGKAVHYVLLGDEEKKRGFHTSSQTAKPNLFKQAQHYHQLAAKYAEFAVRFKEENEL